MLLCWVGEGNGNPLHYSCLENPVDRGVWWAAVHRVAQSWTRLKRLSMHECMGEGNSNPLQYSCLENPRDGGAWWAAIYGVAQIRTWLKRLSSSSSSKHTHPRIYTYYIQGSHSGTWTRVATVNIEDIKFQVYFEGKISRISWWIGYKEWGKWGLPRWC